jgi:phosphoglucosamine mutase
MAIEEIAEVRRTSVGDTFVSEYLKSWGDFGGEPSGSWIFPAHTLCPDGIYAAALFCEIAAEWNIPDVVDSMPAYPVIRKSMVCEDATSILKSLGANVPTDGMRFDDDEGWCLIRASGTEPKIRVTAEGRTLDLAKKKMEFGLSMVKKAKKKIRKVQ